MIENNILQLIRNQYKIIGLSIIVVFIFNCFPVHNETAFQETNSVVDEIDNITIEEYPSPSFPSLVETGYEESEPTNTIITDIVSPVVSPEDTIISDYWLIIENETENNDIRISTTYIEAAQKFEITEEICNITQIKLYIRYIDLFKDGNYPQGTVSIFNDNTGVPGIQLGTTTLEEGFASLDLGVAIGPSWVTYTFSNPITVIQGYYWIVLSDTGNQAKGYWEWFTQDDQTNGDTGDWAAKSTHDGEWVLNPFPPGDLLSEVRIISESIIEPEP
ncbi:MAG: hypothetical protein ACFFAU_18525, partial [Candidatus Hodarchaeota archaeon]